MGLLVPKRSKPKRFSYEPRYYDPTKEDNLRKRMRIQRKALSKRRGRFTGLLYLAGLLLFAFYIYNALM